MNTFIIGGLKVKVQDIDRTQQVTQKLTGLKFEIEDMERLESTDS